MAILNPSPSSPNRCAAGTRIPWKESSVVPEALTPSLYSCPPRANPGVSAETMKAVMPRCFLARSTVAKTSATSASVPLVMNTLLPSST